ncbi:hypothetical protein CEP53_010877 [Fusarium sp. AF-6]|nr:hypothetical protein CEP53_010877 [Fusarium sp. AF-6]
MSDTCKYNCSAHPTEISAYGDISGIGVTTAFFATAWIVVLLLIGYYLTAYDPELDPFREPGKRTLCQHPNAIDYVFLYAARRLPGLRTLQRTDWPRYSQLESALNKCVIMFADIQIFTGLAVLISGYIALSCGLQSYHWQLTVYLVWLASLTHLAALSFLRNHLANHPTQLVWRVIAIFIMMVLLEVAVGLAGHFNWDDGSSKPSDFAACYFREKIDGKSVAFESMIKTLILLAYGFFIRLAKMFKRFEGGLRGFAALLSAKATRLQRGDAENREPWDPLGVMRPFWYQGKNGWPAFFVPCYTLLSIHLNLLTSFLAEVYWLTLSALWVTRRYFKTRLMGPKEENEWTFGQVLPVLLVVAPLAAILEHFLPFRVPADRNRQPLSPIALAILRQLERNEAQDDVRVDMDHQLIHSAAYRGVFLLAAVAYIEIGIFFVADQSPGIQEPLIRLGVAFFILNPLLQFLWVFCAIYASHMKRRSVIRKTARTMTFGALMSVSANEFLLALKEGSSDKREPVYSTLTAYIALSFSPPLLVASLSHNRTLERNSKGPYLKDMFLCFLSFGLLILISFLMSSTLLDFVHIVELTCNIVAWLGLELAWYCFELLVEKFKIALKWAAYLRCVLLLCILAALAVLQFTTSIAPDTVALVISILLSASFWAIVATISSFIRSRLAVSQDDSAASIT